MRKVIARRLTDSKANVPHFYVSVDVELDALMALRAQLNALADGEGEEGVKLSVNDMLIKASAVALKKVPTVNAYFTEEGMLLHEDADISIAVSLDEGLITPIIRKADSKSLREISLEAKSLISRARSGKLKPEEFQGGTFSVSNMGMYGVKDFAAIVNPPQAAILAIAAGRKQPVVSGNEIKIATVMTVTLSVDHRAVDGATAAQWLNAFRTAVQSPLSLVL
jgi:pyruvate dehydrogenase E2 component (dihydrolipoamide acetyltransferase)